MKLYLIKSISQGNLNILLIHNVLSMCIQKLHSISCFSSAWQCRKCEPMIDFLEKWIPMIPGWILENILQQLILPRLQHDVEEWNPLTDTLPIHTWIHPWLPLLGICQVYLNLRFTLIYFFKVTSCSSYNNCLAA